MVIVVSLYLNTDITWLAEYLGTLVGYSKTVRHLMHKYQLIAVGVTNSYTYA